MKFVEWWEGHWKGLAKGALVFGSGTIIVLEKQTSMFGPKTIDGLTLAGALAFLWLQMLTVDPASLLARKLQMQKLSKVRLDTDPPASN